MIWLEALANTRVYHHSPPVGSTKESPICSLGTHDPSISIQLRNSVIEFFSGSSFKFPQVIGHDENVRNRRLPEKEMKMLLREIRKRVYPPTQKLSRVAKMAPNGPHLLVFTSLCGSLLQWIGLNCVTNKILWKWSVTVKARSWKNRDFNIVSLLFLTTCSEGGLLLGYPSSTKRDSIQDTETSCLVREPSWKWIFLLQPSLQVMQPQPTS